MDIKTGLAIAATAAVLFTAGCATQTDTGAATTATPSVDQSYMSAKDRMSCKQKHHRKVVKKKTASAEQETVETSSAAQ